MLLKWERCVHVRHTAVTCIWERILIHKTHVWNKKSCPQKKADPILSVMIEIFLSNFCIPSMIIPTCTPHIATDDDISFNLEPFLSLRINAAESKCTMSSFCESTPRPEKKKYNWNFKSVGHFKPNTVNAIQEQKDGTLIGLTLCSQPGTPATWGRASRAGLRGNVSSHHHWSTAEQVMLVLSLASVRCSQRELLLWGEKRENLPIKGHCAGQWATHMQSVSDSLCWNMYTMRVGLWPSCGLLHLSLCARLFPGIVSSPCFF